MDDKQKITGIVKWFSMVPRIIAERGVPTHSICSFCGAKYKSLMTFGRFIKLLLR